MIPAPAAGPVRLAALALALAVASALPHGGADLPVARAVLAPRLGRGWLPAFLAGYLLLAAGTLAAWRRAPGAALASFLGLSALHFGETDAPGRALGRRLIVGATPILIPVLARPAETAALFATIGGAEGARVASAGRRLGLVWTPAAAALLALPGPRRARAETALVATGFAAIEPLTAFALYFGGLHAPRAFGQTATRLRVGRAALLRASTAPSLAALALLAAGFVAARRRRRTGAALIRTVFIGLSALTVPHMALAGLAARADQSPSSPR